MKESSRAGRASRRPGPGLWEAIEIERNERRIIEIHRTGGVVLREAAHAETTANH